MATDPLLREVVKTLKRKIQNTTDDSTAEELAYLATAVERISGRASLLELEELGDVKMSELTVLAGSTQVGVIAALEDKRVSVNNSINAIRDAGVATITTTRANAIKDTNDTRDAAAVSINATRDAAIAANATSAASAAAAVQSLVLTPARLFFLCQN